MYFKRLSQSHRGKLLLILSAQRSGTRALGMNLDGSLADCSFDNELFGGLAPQSTRNLLNDKFPRLSETWGPYSRNDQIQRQAEEIRRKSIMSDHAVEVVDYLLKSRSGCTVIKVFMNHLEWQVLEEVLETFRPHVIILRRHTLFTLISSLKARSVDGFINVDTTNVAFQLTDVEVRTFVARLDEWFGWTFAATRRANCRTLAATYADVVEGGLGPELVKFLFEGGLISSDKIDGSGLALTKVQDRRTDSSVIQLVQAVRQLNEESLSSLLRLPGPQYRTW